MTLAVGAVEVKMVAPVPGVKVPEFVKLPAILRFEGATNVAVPEISKSSLIVAVPAFAALIVPLVMIMSVLTVVGAVIVMVLV